MELVLGELELPVYVRTDHPLTDDELLRLSSENDALRIEQEPNGELLVMSPAGGGGSSKNAYLTYAVMRWALESGFGQAFDSSGGFRLPDGSVRSPDAALVAWSRWNALTPVQQAKYPPICPEFIIELRSETDSLPALRRKMERWMSNGVELGWLIDPFRKTVDVYRPGMEPEPQVNQSAAYGEGSVSGFVLELGRIWG